MYKKIRRNSNSKPVWQSWNLKGYPIERTKSRDYLKPEANIFDVHVQEQLPFGTSLKLNFQSKPNKDGFWNKTFFEYGRTKQGDLPFFVLIRGDISDKDLPDTSLPLIDGLGRILFRQMQDSYVGALNGDTDTINDIFEKAYTLLCNSLTLFRTKINELGKQVFWEDTDVYGALANIEAVIGITNYVEEESSWGGAKSKNSKFDLLTCSFSSKIGGNSKVAKPKITKVKKDEQGGIETEDDASASSEASLNSSNRLYSLDIATYTFSIDDQGNYDCLVYVFPNEGVSSDDKSWTSISLEIDHKTITQTITEDIKTSSDDFGGIFEASSTENADQENLLYPFQPRAEEIGETSQTEDIVLEDAEPLVVSSPQPTSEVTSADVDIGAISGGTENVFLKEFFDVIYKSHDKKGFVSGLGKVFESLIERRYEAEDIADSLEVFKTIKDNENQRKNFMQAIRKLFPNTADKDIQTFLANKSGIEGLIGRVYTTDANILDILTNKILNTIPCATAPKSDEGVLWRVGFDGKLESVIEQIKKGTLQIAEKIGTTPTPPPAEAEPYLAEFKTKLSELTLANVGASRNDTNWKKKEAHTNLMKWLIKTVQKIDNYEMDISVSLALLEHFVTNQLSIAGDIDAVSIEILREVYIFLNRVKATAQKKDIKDRIINTLRDTLESPIEAFLKPRDQRKPFTQDQLSKYPYLTSSDKTPSQWLQFLKCNYDLGNFLTFQEFVAKKDELDKIKIEKIQLKNKYLEDLTLERIDELKKLGILKGIFESDYTVKWGVLKDGAFSKLAEAIQKRETRSLDNSDYEDLPSKAQAVTDRIDAIKRLESVEAKKVQDAEIRKESLGGATKPQRTLAGGDVEGIRVVEMPHTKDANVVLYTVQFPNQNKDVYGEIVKAAKPFSCYYSQYQKGFICPKASDPKKAAEDFAKHLNEKFKIPYAGAQESTETQVEATEQQISQDKLEKIKSDEAKALTTSSDTELGLQDSMGIDEKIARVQAKRDKLSDDFKKDRQVNTDRRTTIAKYTREKLKLELYYLDLFLKILKKVKENPDAYVLMGKIKHLSEVKSLYSYLRGQVYNIVRKEADVLREQEKKQEVSSGTTQKFLDKNLSDIFEEDNPYIYIAIDNIKRVGYEMFSLYYDKKLSEKRKYGTNFLFSALYEKIKPRLSRNLKLIAIRMANGFVPISSRAYLEEFLLKFGTKCKAFQNTNTSSKEVCALYIGSLPNVKKKLFMNANEIETLYRMGIIDGIGNPVLLKTALREFAEILVDVKPVGQDAEQAKNEKRKELARMNIAGFFPTPPAVVEQVMEYANIHEGDTVLEPSAGTGYLADAAILRGADVSVIEYNATLRAFLEEYGYNVVGDNCLSHDEKYDVVIMNPPFENYQDAKHVKYCFENNLKPGGRLVAIVSSGAVTNNYIVAKTFSNLIENHGFEQDLPQGSFVASDRSTGVNTKIVVLTAPRVTDTTTNDSVDSGIDLETTATDDEEDATLDEEDVSQDLGGETYSTITGINMKVGEGGMVILGDDDDDDESDIKSNPKNPFDNKAFYDIELSEAISPNVENTEVEKVAFHTLKHLVGLPSNSDRFSKTVPTTAEQKRFATKLKEYWSSALPKELKDSFSISLDECYNVVVKIEGLNISKNAKPIAFIAHYDTVPQTRPTSQLGVLKNWDGVSAIPYFNNTRIKANINTFPILEQFKGENVIYGPGDYPFGLDDKLGLTHLVTLSQFLVNERDNEALSHPTIYLIARPDEEIGREDILVPLVKLFKNEGIQFVYTVDGVNRFEVNATCFNAGSFRMKWARQTQKCPNYRWQISIKLDAIPGHTATAYDEKYKPSIRIFSEFVRVLKTNPNYLLQEYLAGNQPPPNTHTNNPALGTLKLLVPSKNDIDIVKKLMADTLTPYKDFGAHFELTVDKCAERLPYDKALVDVFDYLISCDPKHNHSIQYSEDTKEWDGFSDPTQLFCTNTDYELVFRVRDFTIEGLSSRVEKLKKQSTHLGVECKFVLQHQSTDASKPLPRLSYEIPLSCGEHLDLPTTLCPFRAGTGADILTENGIYVCNLGTGYFAPENAKELTSMEMLYQHPLWLFHICQAFSRLEISENQIVVQNTQRFPLELPTPKYHVDTHYRIGDHELHTFGTNRLTLAYCPNDLWVSKYPIYQALWEHMMHNNPSKFKDDKNPVESIALKDILKFCNMLSESEGLEPCYQFRSKTDVGVNIDADGYRLLTEQEWEICAMADQNTYFAGGNDLPTLGWYCGNSGTREVPDSIWEKSDKEITRALEIAKCTTHPVGNLQPNHFGLYDMSGNVWEWCMPSDTDKSLSLSDNQEFPIKGGSYMNCTADCTIEGVIMSPITNVADSLGFRVCKKSSVS